MKRSNFNANKGITSLFLLSFLVISNASCAQNRPEGKQERPTFAKMLTEMDANKDGKLSKNEVKGRLQKDFDTIDSNKDGFITESEFANAPERKRPGKPRNKEQG